MKNLSILLTLLVLAPSAFAAEDPSNTSKAFNGLYSLVNADGQASDEKCPSKIEVKVNSDGVAVNNPANKETLQYFDSTEETGCHQSDGDIGPIRTECMVFGNDDVYNSDTQAITIIGYVSETTELSLSHSDSLNFQHTHTAIPAGILPLWNDEKFDCDYKRIK